MVLILIVGFGNDTYDNTDKNNTFLNWLALNSEDWINPHTVTQMNKYTTINTMFKKHSLHCTLVIDRIPFLCSTMLINYMIGLHPHSMFIF